MQAMICPLSQGGEPCNHRLHEKPFCAPAQTIPIAPMGPEPTAVSGPRVRILP